MRKVCLYHAGCPDGFGAVWAVREAWEGEGEFIARGHDDVVCAGDLEDALVVFVDIAPQVDEARELGDAATQLIVLDHHVTARDRFEAEPELQNQLADEGHVLHFDLTQSGAMLAWQYFAGETAPPDLLRYVQDQDLWHWALPDSSEVNAAIGSYPRTFDTWTELAARPASELADEGRPILRANKIEVERALKNAAPIVIDGRRVEAVNSTVNRALVGHELAERATYGDSWGCVYRVAGSRIHATLYSIGDFNVSEIAKSLGGGGHPNAAGFSVPLSDWLANYLL